MKSKGMLYVKILASAAILLAIFFPEQYRRYAITIILSGAAVILLVSILPRIHLPKMSRNYFWTPRKAAKVPPSDDVRMALLCQLSHRITDKLSSAYADATWDWCKKPNLERFLQGKAERIQLTNVPEFTLAEVSMDTYGTLHLQLMKLKTFSEIVGQEPEPNDVRSTTVDCAAWYELIGESVLTGLVTDLNARGYSKLTIREDGSIVIMEQEKPVVKETLENFPAENYWNELISIFTENGLKAAIAENTLELSW